MALTRAQIENPGDLFANVAANILLADSPAWPFTPYAHRYLGEMANNRIEINASNARRASDHMASDQNGNYFYDHRTLDLVFDIVSQRTDQQATDNHAYCLGRIGWLCSRTAEKFTPSALQNLVILDIRDTGDQRAVDENTDADRSTRHFEIEYVIPPSVVNAAT